MRKPIAVFFLAAFAACALAPAQLLATVIPPSGLAPGSQYQLVFATAGSHDGTSADVSVYNAFVAAQAALNPMLPPATWHAVASTDSINAIVNAPSVGLPVYNTQGILVSSAFSKFYFSTHLAPILYDQFGVANGVRPVWTGSTPEGLEYQGSGIGGLGSMTGRSVDGNASMATFLWADGSGDGLGALFDFYALSTPITVPPIPEPATLTLLASALLLLGGMRLLRRRRGA